MSSSIVLQLDVAILHPNAGQRREQTPVNALTNVQLKLKDALGGNLFRQNEAKESWNWLVGKAWFARHAPRGLIYPRFSTLGKLHSRKSSRTRSGGLAITQITAQENEPILSAEKHPI
jgi:hypothetical protein